MPPTYVKPFLEQQKNDAADAEAILRGGLTPDNAFCRGGQERRTAVFHDPAPHTLDVDKVASLIL